MSTPGGHLAVNLGGSAWSAKVQLVEERREMSFPGAPGVRQ